MTEAASTALLTRIAEALERLAPKPAPAPDFSRADAFIWSAQQASLRPIAHVSCIDLDLLYGIDGVREALFANSLRFAQGFSANNALLWGARGMGKSSLVKAAHAQINRRGDVEKLKLIEIHRDDLPSLASLLDLLREDAHRFILFCDDLSFDGQESSYKSLKSLLEGGIEGRPENVLFYATSNRRHILSRDMIENESVTGIHPGEAIEEKVSLSDRFGLWLGFHPCSQDDYLAMVRGYRDHLQFPIDDQTLEREAIAWSALRGARSGRTAWQFIQDLAGQALVFDREGDSNVK